MSETEHLSAQLVSLIILLFFFPTHSSLCQMAAYQIISWLPLSLSVSLPLEVLNDGLLTANSLTRSSVKQGPGLVHYYMPSPKESVQQRKGSWPSLNEWVLSRMIYSGISKNQSSQSLLLLSATAHIPNGALNQETVYKFCIGFRDNVLSMFGMG